MTTICPHGKVTEDYGKKSPCPMCESVPVVKPVATPPANLWEQYENRHDDYPWRDRNDAVLFDKWWTYRMAARFDEKEIKGSGKTYGSSLLQRDDPCSLREAASFWSTLGHACRSRRDQENELRLG